MFIDEITGLQPFWGEWVIESKIGEGSFGSVYRIKRQDFTFVNMAAMKVICVPRDQKEHDSILEKNGSVEAAQKYCNGIRDQLLNEIKIMNRFKGNTNIVSMEDYKVIACDEGDFGFSLIIRMELCKSVNDYIGAQQDYFSKPSELVKLGVAMCDALEVIHSNSVLHRDIKPGNIMVSQDGYFKLGDFGMAGSRYEGLESSQVAGTYDYMAPEIYNHLGYDNRADIYSLGLTLYYFANGLRGPYLEDVHRAPTREDKNVALTRRLKNEPMKAPALTTPNVATVILRACAYDPNARYNSAAELKAALIAAENGTAAQPSLNRFSQSGSVIYNQMLQGGSVSYSSTFSGSVMSGSVNRPNANIPQQPKTKSKKGLIIALSSIAVALLAGVCIWLVVSSGSGISDNVWDNSDEEIANPDSVSEEELSVKKSDDKDTSENTADMPEGSDEPQEETDMTPLQEKIRVVLDGEVTARSLTNKILRNCSPDEIVLEGVFTDGNNNVVDGDLMLVHDGTIDASGTYEWSFEPFQNELYDGINGEVYILALNPNMVVGLAEYEAVEDKREIVSLSLEGEHLSDVSFLSEAINLEKLNLDDNDIVSLNGLEKCTHLQTLAFNDNLNLSNIDAILGLKELKKVYSDSTGLKQTDIDKINNLIGNN